MVTLLYIVLEQNHIHKNLGHSVVYATHIFFSEELVFPKVFGAI